MLKETLSVASIGGEMSVEERGTFDTAAEMMNEMVKGRVWKELKGRG